MKIWKPISIFLAALLGILALMAAFWFLLLPRLPFGFALEVAPEEKAIRMELVAAAESWLGTEEGSENHDRILNIYNAHQPLAEGYLVKQEDNWCAAFASAMAISQSLTDRIPTECGCERQTKLWQAMNRWEEKDSYVPLPGDFIYYAWDEFSIGDCTGWADHVGIVVGTWGPFIKVIEGNWKDSVSYHYVLIGDLNIRGFGLPDFTP